MLRPLPGNKSKILKVRAGLAMKAKAAARGIIRRFCPVIWHWPAIFGTLAGFIGVFARFHAKGGR
jgi:hypothetical protein